MMRRAPLQKKYDLTHTHNSWAFQRQIITVIKKLKSPYVFVFCMFFKNNNSVREILNMSCYFFAL